MRRARLIKKYKIKRSTKYIFIIIIIFLLALTIYNRINNKMNTKVLTLIHNKLDVINKAILNQTISSEFLGDIQIDDILIVNTNKNEEITLIDFNMNNSYSLLRGLIGNLESNIRRLQNGDIDQLFYNDSDILSKNGLMIQFPLGMVSDYAFLNNLGPRIPLKVQLGGTVVAGFDTRITEYGINNSLIEVFIKCNLAEQIFLPLNTKKVNFEYEFLIATKIIQGKIPTYYGGALNTKSPMISMPII